MIVTNEICYINDQPYVLCLAGKCVDINSCDIIYFIWLESILILMVGIIWLGSIFILMATVLSGWEVY